MYGVLHYVIFVCRFVFFLIEDATTSKDKAPEKIQKKISAFCFSQESKLELPKTKVPEETSKTRAPTGCGAVPVFPLELEPECGRYM